MTDVFENQLFKVEVVQGANPVLYQEQIQNTLLFGPAKSLEELDVTITNFSRTTYVVYFATNDVTKLRNRPVMTKAGDLCNGMVLSENQEVKCRTRIVGGDEGWDGEKWAVVGPQCVYLIICEDKFGHLRPEVGWNDQDIQLTIKITSESATGAATDVKNAQAPMCALLRRMAVLNGK